MVSAYYFLGSKQKLGRSPGTGYTGPTTSTARR